MATGWRLKVGEDLIEWEGVDASPEYFEIFEVPFLKGGHQEMYESPEAIAISESFAETYFGEDWGTQEIIGTLMENDKDQVKRLVGVYRDFPSYSTIQHQFVVPFRNRIKTRANLLSWDNSSSQLFVKLEGGGVHSRSESKTTQFHYRSPGGGNTGAERGLSSAF